MAVGNVNQHDASGKHEQAPVSRACKSALHGDAIAQSLNQHTQHTLQHPRSDRVLGQCTPCACVVNQIQAGSRDEEQAAPRSFLGGWLLQPLDCCPHDACSSRRQPRAPSVTPFLHAGARKACHDRLFV
eukprot:175341-Chlamydomonas_euryale.AAC.2